MAEVKYSGRVTDADGESWVDWALLDRRELEAYVGFPVWNWGLMELEQCEEVVDVAGFTLGFSDGPGQRFAHVPSIRVVHNRVLVKQMGGWDI